MRAGLAAMAILLALPAAAAEVHGKTYAFSAPGIALAWAVERGRDEASTFVVIRVAADPSKYHAISVVGRDPFTQAERTWMGATALSGRIDVRLARPGFGDFPRTHLRFFDSASAKPALEVYYLGVPDTTPEFDDRAKLDAYLDGRIRGLFSPSPAPRSRRTSRRARARAGCACPSPRAGR